MRILWITNTIFPELSKSLGSKSPVVGGWMYGLASAISNHGISLTVVTSRPNIVEHHTSINGTEYILLNRQKPVTEYDKSLENSWRKIIELVKPDVVHIHGTEYTHGLSLMKALPKLKYVISIQGLIGVYSRYYLGGISVKEIIKTITFRDIIKRDSILQAKNKFAIRGEKVENEYLRSASHFIGRTQWDYDHVKTINPKGIYHFCNESLREEFYHSPKWNIENKINYTIFLSQAAYPIKGLHKVLEAIHIMKKVYPNIKLRIAGDDITRQENFKDKFRAGGYSKYIKKLIDSFQLEDNIAFLGPLQAEAMIKEYINCHVFVCPSSIENSPNSLGEAQILGVPCIASYVGGVPDMVANRENGLLYRFEEVEMLAQRINEIFSNDELAKKLSHGGIQTATERHNREYNAENTIEIYKNIMIHDSNTHL